ncbi:uncharacterized protein [Lepeophtheirus salmonis]|uniref:Uncharacterized protein n=2 Tax=Lepeophtheirus salmonis TaxID=72036 RepID=A0A0K2VCA8_LEPSM|nr:uncharacterized protein LOC121127581 [Lepeophtheirus salmonis]
MPPFKVISSLYNLSLDLIAETLLKNHAGESVNTDNETDFEAMFSSSPPGMNLSDTISEKILGKYSLNIPLSLMFKRCVPFNIVRLDLTGFVRFGPIDSDVFHEFDEALYILLKKIPRIRELFLKTHEKFTYIPKVRNHHMYIIGNHCVHLEVLDISYNKLVTGEGLKYLLNCKELRKLYLFKVSTSEHEVVRLLDSLPNLVHLGYKSLGNVVNTLRKRLKRSFRGMPHNRRLKLTHIDNTGAYNNRVSCLRCKPSLLNVIKETCPDIKTLKLRVKDEDLFDFSLIESVRNVEFVYNVGVPASPSNGTLRFLVCSGKSLTSISLICSFISTPILRGIALECVMLESLWIRCNYFNDSSLGPFLEKKHGHLKRLKILYIRVGENEEQLPVLPKAVFTFILQNAGQTLSELTVFMLSPTLTDAYIYELFVELHLVALQKVLFLVPGENNSGGLLPLTIETLRFLLNFCPNLIKIGNIACWNVRRGEILLDPNLNNLSHGNYKLNIVDKR